MIDKETLQFIRDLKQHNEREWFNANKDRYEKGKENFSTFIQALIDRLDDFDHHLHGLKAEDCIFRIYRDIRFSKNKAPYKTHFGAYIAFGGRKSEYAGFYFHLEPGESFIGGGMYKPHSAVLRKIRQEIDYNPQQIKGILGNKDFKRVFGEIQGERLKTAPQGYPKDHPEIALLRRKSFFAMSPLTDKALLSDDLLELSVERFRLLFPLNQFFNETFIN